MDCFRLRFYWCSNRCLLEHVSRYQICLLPLLRKQKFKRIQKSNIEPATNVLYTSETVPIAHFNSALMLKGYSQPIDRRTVACIGVKVLFTFFATVTLTHNGEGRFTLANLLTIPVVPSKVYRFTVPWKLDLANFHQNGRAGRSNGVTGVVPGSVRSNK